MGDNVRNLDTGTGLNVDQEKNESLSVRKYEVSYALRPQSQLRPWKSWQLCKNREHMRREDQE